MRHSDWKRKTLEYVGREDIGSAAGIPISHPPPGRCLPRSKSREARPWLSAAAPATPRRQRSRASGRDKAVRIVDRRQTFCRVHAVALRVVHGQLSVAPRPVLWGYVGGGRLVIVLGPPRDDGWNSPRPWRADKMPQPREPRDPAVSRE
jgi:hypothetical protein